jgi:hypothetical protein
MSRAPRFPNKFVVIGTMFVLAGLLLLLWTVGEVGNAVRLWPLTLLLAGLVLLYYRIFRRGPDWYVFLGVALLLAGVLLIITSFVVPLQLSAIWPFFMTICGVALLLYGLRKSGYTRLSLTVPGTAMLLLSLLFLPFSLGLVDATFSEVVTDWWPLILVLLGITFLALHLARGKAGRK